MKDDSVYLQHILECIRRIEEDIAEAEHDFWPCTLSRTPC